MKLPWAKKDNEEGTIEFPDELKKKIDDSAAATAELPRIKELLEGMNSFVADAKKEREEAARVAAAKRTQEHQESVDDEIESLILTNPKEAIKKATDPLAQLLLQTRADGIKRELFEDQDKFKYYTGDIKREVDALIAGQQLSFKIDPASLENAYHAVVGKHFDEIQEGKLKTRFASSTGGNTSNGNAGDTAVKDYTQSPIAEDIKKAAKQFGIDPKEYAKMLDTEGIGYI